MENWFEITMSDPELITDYYAKINEEDDVKNELVRKRRHLRENSWVRKRLHRKKMVRKFLSLNPAMKIVDLHPLPSLNAIFINFDVSTNGGLYNINYVTHIYMAPGGNLETFRGTLEWWGTGRVFGIGSKNRDLGRITNRRIRYMKIEEGLPNYSFCKKKFSPIDYGIL